MSHPAGTSTHMLDRSGKLTTLDSITSWKYLAIAAGITLPLYGITYGVLLYLGRLPETGLLSTGGALITGVAFGSGVYGLLWGGRFYRLRRLVTQTAVAKIRSLGLGPCQLAGTVVPGGQLLRSPFSRTDCVAYRYEVQVRRETRTGRHTWETVASDQDGVRFLVSDGSGQITVNPRDAWLALAEQDTITVPADEAPPRQLEQFARGSGRDTDDLPADARKLFVQPMDQQRRFVEYYISPGASVRVFGDALPASGAGPSARGENMVIGADDSTPLFAVTDGDMSAITSYLGRRALLHLLGGGIIAAAAGAGFLLSLGIIP